MFKGFPKMLAVLFIGLKLTNYIDWSWVWVLSPVWITLSLPILHTMLEELKCYLEKQLEK